MSLTLALGQPLHSGLGARFASGTPRVAPTTCALLVLGALAIILPWQIAMAALPGVLTGLTAAHFIARRLGGFNGDVHGAGGIIAETSTLYFCLMATLL
jgi:cobalamin synthase